MNPPDSAGRQAWERDKQAVYDNFTQNAPRVRLPDGYELKKGDAFEYGYLYGYQAAQAVEYVRGWNDGEADAERLRAESAGKDTRIADLERELAVTEHTSDVAHSSVFEMDARITTLETALQKIERYDDLPGDWTTTIARIARAALGAAQEPGGGENDSRPWQAGMTGGQVDP